MAVALALALPASVWAAVGEVPVAEPAPPAEATTIAYGQASTCMALYVILGSQYDRETEEAQAFRTLFAAWSDFAETHYPEDFLQNGERDLQAEADRLADEFNAMDEDQFKLAIDRQIDLCQNLEDAGRVLK